MTKLEAMEEVIKWARQIAYGFCPENGYIGPHRYGLSLCEAVKELDKIDGIYDEEDWDD